MRASLARSSHGAERGSPLFLAVQRSERRKALSSRQVSKLFHRYAREERLPVEVTPHSARATFLAEAPDRKCSIRAIQVFGCSRPLMRKIYNQRELYR